MGPFFAKLFFPGQLGGPKNLEKLFLDRYINWLLGIILTQFLGPSIMPGKNNLAENGPIHCLSGWDLNLLFTSYEMSNACQIR